METRKNTSYKKTVLKLYSIQRKGVSPEKNPQSQITKLNDEDQQKESINKPNYTFGTTENYSQMKPARMIQRLKHSN